MLTFFRSYLNTVYFERKFVLHVNTRKCIFISLLIFQFYSCFVCQGICTNELCIILNDTHNMYKE